MKKQKENLVVYFVLTLAVLWSSTTLLSGVEGTFAQLRGSAEACNCDSCSEDSKPFNECLHTVFPPDANGSIPVPDANDPNWIKDPNASGCSKDYCIKNTIKGAKCPPLVGGADCPMKEDKNLWRFQQEIYNNATGCNEPNYAIAPQDEKCAGFNVTGACITASCGGDGSTKIDPNDYNYDEYRGGDPNHPDPNEHYGRYICDN